MRHLRETAKLPISNNSPQSRPPFGRALEFSDGLADDRSFCTQSGTLRTCGSGVPSEMLLDQHLFVDLAFVSMNSAQSLLEAAHSFCVWTAFAPHQQPLQDACVCSRCLVSSNFRWCFASLAAEDAQKSDHGHSNAGADAMLCRP